MLLVILDDLDLDQLNYKQKKKTLIEKFYFLLNLKFLLFRYFLFCFCHLINTK